MPISPNIRRRKELSGIEGVSAGGVATVPITTGMSYDKIVIEYTEFGVLSDILDDGLLKKCRSFTFAAPSPSFGRRS
ncbi:hypothetical protein [Pelagicoccus sp. SDUM812005]|uniref:hypothetical protein n=1 Tax=Pelagicoccus sp. SDUM812005 TaxID=3041257 RepID=UPI00280D1693|nr:hypothetical protein [Pelagicoccus sp. SDUM812005]MDQ8183748.1 hypothetical protein [Pelagicoccus sp. SDUM812005]